MVVSVVSFWSLGSLQFDRSVLVISVVLHVSLVSFRFVSLFRVLVNVINFHDIISSSWLLGKIRVISTRAF